MSCFEYWQKFRSHNLISIGFASSLPILYSLLCFRYENNYQVLFILPRRNRKKTEHLEANSMKRFQWSPIVSQVVQCVAIDSSKLWMRSNRKALNRSQIGIVHPKSERASAWTNWGTNIWHLDYKRIEQYVKALPRTIQKTRGTSTLQQGLLSLGTLFGYSRNTHKSAIKR